MPAAIRLSNVQHRFGRVTALDGLSLTVGEGQLYGFLGRNGAGKTTTLRILMGV
jgi:ABC-2 type transport system ATP-binding protein